MKIAIGICARNEESSIVQMLDSLALSILKDLNKNDFCIFLCANGCSDQTIPLIQGWQMKNHSIDSDLFIINEANLIEAQRVIVNKSKELSFESIIFLDADITINEDCIPELINNSLEKEIMVVYAVSIPIKRSRQSLIEKSLNLYDTSTNIFSERKHLHGRAFLIKTEVWNIPKTNPKLIADDIYLSFYLLKSFGPKSIKKISTAKVYFKQVSRYPDLYNAFRRNLINESFGNIFLWLFLLYLRKIAKLQFKAESFLGFEENNQWIVTKTSKKINVDKKPILILIEGLDCSGKKTTARLLQSELINNGISCIINIGPLNSKVYRLLSRLVSLHRFPDFIRSIVYAFDGAGDRKWYRSFNSQIVIHIASPMRNWSYALVNKKYLRILSTYLIRNSIPKYDSVWYLTAPYDIRIERHASQIKHKENPDEINNRFPSEAVFDQMEYELKKLLNTYNKIEKEFDTTISSYKDIVDHMSHIVKNFLV